MKILHLAPWFYPATGFGGGPSGVYELSKMMVERGHDVVVLTTNALSIDNTARNFKKEEEMDGILIKRFPIYFKLAQFYFAPNMLKQALKEEKDIIHGHGYRNGTDFGVIVAKACRKPFIMSTYGCLPYFNLRDVILKGGYDKMTFNYFLKNTDLFIARSNVEAETIAKAGISSSKIKVIPHGIKLVNIMDKNSDPHSFLKGINLSGKKNILFVGRITPIKGLDFLINAFLYVSKCIESAILLLVGPDQDYWAYLQKLARSLGLENKIYWIDAVDRKLLRHFYKIADVCVITSRFESSPSFVLFEAGAMGKPLIATNVGAIPELIEHGKTGLLVNYGNVNQLSSAILRILSDEILAKNLGREIKRKITQEYSWKNISEKLEKTYNALLYDST